MMAQTIKTAPPNSLIFVTDAQGGSVPDPNKIAREAGITATSSCVVVCCLAEMDGKTEITMGPTGEVNPGQEPDFDGKLATPTGTVVISTTERETLLEANVRTLQTQIRIWTNRAREPDRVIVGIG
jgi:hypothetical protein